MQALVDLTYKLLPHVHPSLIQATQNLINSKESSQFSSTLHQESSLSALRGQKKTIDSEKKEPAARNKRNSGGIEGQLAAGYDSNLETISQMSFKFENDNNPIKVPSNLKRKFPNWFDYVNNEDQLEEDSKDASLDINNSQQMKGLEEGSGNRILEDINNLISGGLYNRYIYGDSILNGNSSGEKLEDPQMFFSSHSDDSSGSNPPPLEVLTNYYVMKEKHADYDVVMNGFEGRGTLCSN